MQIVIENCIAVDNLVEKGGKGANMGGKRGLGFRSEQVRCL